MNVEFRRIFACCIIGLSCFLSGCSIPQVVILDDPLTPREHLELGLSYESRHQLDIAYEHYQKAARHNIPEAFLYMGNTAFRQKDYPKAETLYRKAIRKMPDDPRAYNNLAWTYYKQRRNLEKAENLARKALDLAPPDNRSNYLDTLEKILILNVQVFSVE